MDIYNSPFTPYPIPPPNGKTWHTHIHAVVTVIKSGLSSTEHVVDTMSSILSCKIKAKAVPENHLTPHLLCLLLLHLLSLSRSAFSQQCNAIPFDKYTHCVAASQTMPTLLCHLGILKHAKPLTNWQTTVNKQSPRWKDTRRNDTKKWGMMLGG